MAKYTITREMVIQATKRSLEQGRCAEDGRCVYTREGGKHCVAGHALALAGVSDAEMDSRGTIHLLLQRLDVTCTESVSETLKELQKLHDAGQLYRYRETLGALLDATAHELEGL